MQEVTYKFTCDECGAVHELEAERIVDLEGPTNVLAPAGWAVLYDNGTIWRSGINWHIRGPLRYICDKHEIQIKNLEEKCDT